MQLPPGQPQFGCRPIEQFAIFAVNPSGARIVQSVAPIADATRERATARQSAGEPTRPGLAASCACGLGGYVLRELTHHLVADSPGRQIPATEVVQLQSSSAG